MQNKREYNSGSLPHKHKIVIAGNHEIGFEDGEELNEKQLAGLNMLGVNKPYQLLTNCSYLCDQQIEVCLPLALIEQEKTYYILWIPIIYQQRYRFKQLIIIIVNHLEPCKALNVKTFY